MSFSQILIGVDISVPVVFVLHVLSQLQKLTTKKYKS